jgi:hypothetical protein
MSRKKGLVLKKINNTLLFNHQLLFLFVALAIFTLSFLFARPYRNCGNIETPTIEEYRQCHTRFCQVIVKTYDIHHADIPHVSKVAKVTYLIFSQNLVSEWNAIIAVDYYGTAPLISWWMHSGQLSSALKCGVFNPPFIKTFFPHGWLEFLAMVLSLSFIYASLINLILVIQNYKKKSYIKSFIKKFFIQLLVIIAMYLVAAFLEAMAVFSG